MSWLRLSFLSNIPRRFKIIEKCFFVAVVTVLITAPSNKDGDDELRLLDIKWSCLEDKIWITLSSLIKKKKKATPKLNQHIFFHIVYSKGSIFPLKNKHFASFLNRQFLRSIYKYITWYNENTMCRALHTEWRGNERPGRHAQSSDSYSEVQTQLETGPTSDDVPKKVNVWLLQDIHDHTKCLSFNIRLHIFKN